MSGACIAVMSAIGAPPPTPPAGTFGSDTFDGPASTALQSHTPNFGGAWVLVNGSTNAALDGAGSVTDPSFNGPVYRKNDAPASADYGSKALAIATATTGHYCPGPAMRLSSSTNTGILSYFNGSSGEWRVYERTAGTDGSTLITYAGDNPFTAAVDVEVRCVGTTLTLYTGPAGGTLTSRGTATATITAAGFPGLQVVGHSDSKVGGFEART